MRFILGIITGVVCAVALFCLITAIGCAVNGLTFGQQITSWFGEVASVVDQTVEQVADAAANAPIM
jgi:hypothetical protein